MKHRIKWKCQPATYGYHLVATADVGGKQTNVNVAIEKMVWDRADDHKALLVNVSCEVDIAFKTITAALSQRPACATLH